MRRLYIVLVIHGQGYADNKLSLGYSNTSKLSSYHLTVTQAGKEDKKAMDWNRDRVPTV